MTISTRIYTRVLVPLDGSQTAEFAIRFGADLANKHGAELFLLLLDTLPAKLGPSDESADETERAQAREKAQKNLAELHDRLEAEGFRVRAQTITTRDPHDALLKTIDTERVSAVVMSTQGRVPMLRWLFGSGVEKALDSFPVPIMLVRPMYGKIVVPLDGSKWSESAIPRAVEIARVHNAELILLHVYQSPSGSYSADWALAGQQQIADQSFAQLREQLVSLRNLLRHEGINVREQIIHSGSPAQAICDFAESEEGINLIVMSTHGRTGLSRWLVGSVAQKVMKNTRCPVTLVQPDKH